MLPNHVLDTVKKFLIRWVKDSAFVAQLQTGSADQVQSLLQEAGYNFSQDDFESASLQILDLKEQNQFHELSEAELVGAVGGWLRLYPRYSGRFRRRPYPTKDPVVQPMYGVVIEPPGGELPGPQPMYGVVIEPTNPVAQPMYGVVVSSEIR